MELPCPAPDKDFLAEQGTISPGDQDIIDFVDTAQEAWDIMARFYEIAFHRDAWLTLMNEMKERGIALPWDMDSVVGATPADELNPSNAAALGQVAESLEEGSEASWEESFGRSDEEVTTRVDVSAFLDAKRRSMDCHKTQRQDLGWMLDLPPDLADRVMATECYVLRWLDGAEVSSSHRETSLVPAGKHLG